MPSNYRRIINLKSVRNISHRGSSFWNEFVAVFGHRTAQSCLFRRNIFFCLFRNQISAVAADGEGRILIGDGLKRDLDGLSLPPGRPAVSIRATIRGVAQGFLQDGLAAAYLGYQRGQVLAVVGEAAVGRV